MSKTEVYRPIAAISFFSFFVGLAFAVLGGHWLNYRYTAFTGYYLLADIGVIIMITSVIAGLTTLALASRARNSPASVK